MAKKPKLKIHKTAVVFQKHKLGGQAPLRSYRVYHDLPDKGRVKGVGRADFYIGGVWIFSKEDDDGEEFVLDPGTNEEEEDDLNNLLVGWKLIYQS